jgi:hypothetical protein
MQPSLYQNQKEEESTEEECVVLSSQVKLITLGRAYDSCSIAVHGTGDDHGISVSLSGMIRKEPEKSNPDGEMPLSASIRSIPSVQSVSVIRFSYTVTRITNAH